MIIYNVTVSVEESVKNDWLQWMKTKHIPEVMACGLFLKAQLNRVISKDDSDNTFAISYTCSSMKNLHEYQIKYASDLKKDHNKRFGDKAIAFRTLMEVIEKF